MIKRSINSQSDHRTVTAEGSQTCSVQIKKQYSPRFVSLITTKSRKSKNRKTVAKEENIGFVICSKCNKRFSEFLLFHNHVWSIHPPNDDDDDDEPEAATESSQIALNNIRKIDALSGEDDEAISRFNLAEINEQNIAMRSEILFQDQVNKLIAGLSGFLKYLVDK